MVENGELVGFAHQYKESLEDIARSFIDFSLRNGLLNIEGLINGIWFDKLPKYMIVTTMGKNN